jgi:twitching motility protein PilT
MRDPETIRLALTAAETGHLVLSTVHASDAVGVVNRLVDVFPGDEQPQVRTMLANTLLGASCQTLVKDAVVEGRRHLVAEVLVVNGAIRACIREGRAPGLAQAVETGAAEGMQTFDQAFARAVADGKVARAEAEALTPDRALFLRSLRELARRP